MKAQNNSLSKVTLMQIIPVMLCFFAMGFVDLAVSYTHLTLPTICSV